MTRMQMIELAMAKPFIRPDGIDGAILSEVRSLRAALVWACGECGCDMDDLRGLSAFELERIQLRHRMAMAAPPERCGPAMIAQPARGPMVASAPMGMIPEGKDEWKAEHTGFCGRDIAREADAFDAMELQARRAAGGRKDGGERLFTPLQVATGRRYAMLVERHASSGMRCTSVETQGGGSGQGGSFIDTVIHEGDLICAMQRAIGDGVSLAIRRIRPSQRGARTGIRDRALVDAVCLSGKTVSCVLEAHGWADKGDNRLAARRALCGALDRMAMAFVPSRFTRGLDA
jgi:hypothetical protein